MKKYDIDLAVSMLEEMTQEQRHEALNYIRFIYGFPQGDTLLKFDKYWVICAIFAFILILS